MRLLIAPAVSVTVSAVYVDSAERRTLWVGLESSRRCLKSDLRACDRTIGRQWKVDRTVTARCCCQRNSRGPLKGGGGGGAEERGRETAGGGRKKVRAVMVGVAYSDGRSRG